MRGFFRFKRFLHVFINKIFYFIAFALGFMLGGGTLEKVVSFFNNIFHFNF